MPKFMYKVVDHSGVPFKGTLEAQSFQQAMDELKRKGYWITELLDQSQSVLHREIKFGGPKVKVQQFTLFCRQLATLYKSGVSMVDSVKALAEQMESKEFRNILSEVAASMQQGTQMSEAASRYPTVFSGIFINMLRAGELSGNLDEMLNRLAVFYEKEHYTREKVKSAMVYPVIMAILTVIVVTLMMLFVIPNYVSSFESMGLELPLPTRIVVEVSNWIVAYWYAIPVIVFVPSLLVGLIKRHPKGPYWIDYAKLRIPVFGKLLHKQAIARFSRTFSSLFTAAIPMLQALTLVSSVTGNVVIGKVIEDARDGLVGGKSITDPFRQSWLFPPMVVQMMSVGEQSGALDTMLEKVADFYEADVDAMTDRLKSLLEPLMIVALSGVVGGIVLAVMLPTFEMMKNGIVGIN
ncbi:type IV pilus assembly protein PilC [Paenibacillus sp. UNCCL117]|uniref:type II secretion system F family protein n=1 Tax=unclassified Paenibacillus TaxID=185978 RepID=UPI00087FC567|nr:MULTISPECIES: type II secretion system F family protein [unclassified Paenibacillus]SDC46721.1 type IV pilus assembly protein PilC [Paenibacillus sp. cl123]SFW12251.1 type IV pilus assembly protein PilC [Paenibacillus sp. UNCCL117]